MALAADTHSPALKSYRWTVSRYHKAVEAGIFDGQPIELLDGELFETSPEGIPHGGVSSDGADHLREKLGNRVKIREAKPITLPNNSEPEPDIAIVKPPGDLYKTERHPCVSDIFWVIEYAETSLEKDLKLKSKIYAEAGIFEYWVINLKTRELVVFRNPVGNAYQSKKAMTSGLICPVSFPKIQIEISRLVR